MDHRRVDGRDVASSRRLRSESRRKEMPKLGPSSVREIGFDSHSKSINAETTSSTANGNVSPPPDMLRWQRLPSLASHRIKTSCGSDNDHFPKGVGRTEATKPEVFASRRSAKRSTSNAQANGTGLLELNGC
nr:hypothetical protein CFP56_43941 [Quercus suber]